MEEQWKSIEGYSRYEVSNLGRVRSLDFNHTKKTKILKPELLNSGYLAVALWDDTKKVKLLTIHRLVAKAFILNLNNYRCVNHIDENKTNNNASNLEWCTDVYNHNYGTKRRRLSIALTDNPHIIKAVHQIDKQGNIIKEYSSIVRASKATGINKANISKVCLGLENRHTAGGYIWRFKI